MRLFKSEIYKTWTNKQFLLLLALLCAVNLFLLFNGTRPAASTPPPTAYKQLLFDLSPFTAVQKDAYIQENYDKILAIYQIDELLKAETTAKSDDYYTKQLREQLAPLLEQYGDIYAAGDWLRYTDSLYLEYKLFEQVGYEVREVSGYAEFLANIQKKAKQLSSISIFANSGGYDSENIKLAAAAYENMGDISPEYLPQKGIRTATNFRLTDVIMVFAMLLLASSIVRGERDNGLVNLIRSTAAGRSATAVAKLVALGFGLFAVILLLYGSNLAYCGVVFGFGDLLRPVQSLPFMLRSTMHINVLQYLGVFVLTKWAAALVSGIFVMAAAFLTRRAVVGYAVGLSLLGGNLLLREMFSATGKLNVLKYANLVSILDTNELLSSYRNLYWFGSPIQLVIVEGVAALIFFIIFVLLFVRLFCSLPIITAGRLSLTIQTKLPKSTTVFKTESYKLLLMGGGLMVLLLFLGYSVYSGATAKSYITADEMYYRRYMKNISGTYDRKAYDFLVTENEKFAPIYELQAMQTKGASTAQTEALAMSTYALQQEFEVFERIKTKLKYVIEKPGAELVYDTGYPKFFGLKGNGNLTALLLSVLCCSLTLAGVFATEKQSGMTKVLFSTPLGRKVTLRAKVKLAVYISAVVALTATLPECIRVVRDYGLPNLLAPAYSLYEFEKISGAVPLLGLVILHIAMRILACSTVAIGTLALSQLLGNTLLTLLSSAFAFGFTPLLALLNVRYASWLSLFALFNIVSYLSEGRGWMMLVYIAVSLGGIWPAYDYLKDDFGMPLLK